MPLFRLFGLALLITAIFLGLAAAITQTTYIRIQSALPTAKSMPTLNGPMTTGPAVLPPSFEPKLAGKNRPIEPSARQVTLVPVVWPLIIAAGAGLLMWFSHPTQFSRSSTTSTKRRPRRR